MVLFGNLSCDFNAVKTGQVSAVQGERVEIVTIKDGYAVIRKKNDQQGKIPSYFLESIEDYSIFEEKILEDFGGEDCGGDARHDVVDDGRRRNRFDLNQNWDEDVDEEETADKSTDPSTNTTIKRLFEDVGDTDSVVINDIEYDDLQEANVGEDLQGLVNDGMPSPYISSIHFDQLTDPLFVNPLITVPEPPSDEPPPKQEIFTFQAIVPQEGPLFPSNSPYFIEQLRDISVRYGEPIELRAQIGSRHEFGLKWIYPDLSRRDVTISAPSDTGIISLLLSHANLRDAGHYHVVLASDYGKTTSMCTVNVVREPSKPLKLEHAIDPAKKMAIRLRWTPPENTGGSKMLWYTVEYTRPGLNQFFEVIQGVKEHCIRISHLQDTEYTFRVFACNEYFAGEPSDLITVNAAEIEAILSKERAKKIQQKLGVDLLKTCFAECFNVEHKIGKGRKAIVYQVKCKISSTNFAGKFFNCSNDDFDFNLLNREIAVLSSLNCPNIVHYFGTALFEDQIIVIMDKVNGQQILNYVIDCGFLSEALMQKFTSDLLTALVYLHSRGIAHLGIKPEELIVDASSKTPSIMLIDFGSAECFQGCDPMNTPHLSVWQGGSVEYLAPEQLAHRPCCKSDVWALGVLLFVLATGVSPFEDVGDPDEVTRQRILDGEIADCREKLAEYSPHLLQIIAGIFAVDHKERLSSFACMYEPWITCTQNENLFMVDHVEDYVDNRRDRMRSSFLLHEI